MAITQGTTERNLRTLCRATLLAILLLAPLCLWWPTMSGWAALASGVLGVWVLWLCWRTTGGQARIPFHMLNLALLGVMAVEAYHLVRSGLGQPEYDDWALNGQLDISLVLQVALIALLVMMTQDLVSSMRWPWLGVTLLGLATVAGSLVALGFGPDERGRLMLSLMGWTGLAMFLSPLWRIDEVDGPHREQIRRMVGRHARGLLGLAVAIALAGLCPSSVPLVLLAGGFTLLVSALCLPGRRWQMLLAGLVALGAALLLGWLLGWLRWPSWPHGLAGWLGQGEKAIGNVWAWDAGPVFLAGTIGWAGMLWMAGGMAGCLVWAMAHTRRGHKGDLLRAVLWVFAATLATLALLAPGGLFTPAVNVVFALTWALLPGMLGQTPRLRSGWWILIPLLALCVLFGLARNDGLLTWMVVSLHAGEGLLKEDSLLHLAVGWLLTQVLLWLLARRWWMALLAGAVSIAAEATGELAQYFYYSRTGRHAEGGDVMMHAIGALAAIVLYALSRGSLWCESPDIPPASIEHRPGIT